MNANIVLYRGEYRDNQQYNQNRNAHCLNRQCNNVRVYRRRT